MEENLYTFVFRNADGTGTMRLYSHPVKYIDSEGETRDITLDVKEDGNGGYVSADHYVVTQFPHDFTEGIELGYEDTDLRITAEITGENVFAEKTGGSVTYSADENTDYVYTLTYEGIKEDIVVSEYTGQTDYSFILDTAGLAVSENDGSYYLMDDKNEVKAAIGDIIVYSADDSNNTTGEIICDEITPNEQYRITLHVDDEYLSDEATVYPIRIDPTINVNYTNNGDGGISDVTVYDNNSFDGTTSNLYVGRKNGMKARTLMKFPGLSLTNIHSSLNVTSATLDIWDLGTTSNSVKVFCYLFAGNNWSELSAVWNNIGINKYPMELSFITLNCNTSTKYSFDITNAVKCWKDGSCNKSRGILLKAKDSVESGSTDKFRQLASYNRTTLKPSLKVVFTYGVIRNQYYFKYDPDKYNDEENEAIYGDVYHYSYLIKYRMNCYGYALGYMVDDSGPYNSQQYGTGYLHQPGEFAYAANNNYIQPTIYSNNPSLQMSNIASNMGYDADRLGFTIQNYNPQSTQIEQFGDNSRLIALVNSVNGEKFHFYVQHSDGTWSHKPGYETVRNTSFTTNVILTNDNIYIKSREGDYAGGMIRFFIITKNTVLDFPHQARNRELPPFNTGTCSIYDLEKAGEYLETSRILPYTASSRADFLKDHDVYYFEDPCGVNYTITASGLTVFVYNIDGGLVQPISGNNVYYLSGGAKYFIEVVAGGKQPESYSLNITI